MKLITFSLWGNDPKYCEGAIQNAILAKELYPDWMCLFYFDKITTPPTYFYQLTAFDNVIVRDMPEELRGWKGMLARFYPASEDNVDVFISRDCDSRLSQREADAVQEWLDSPYLIHTIRDHPEHTAPLMGGLWGAKRHAVPDMKTLIEQWNKEDRWQTDQEFLRDVICRRYGHKILAHDNWGRFNGVIHNRPLPTGRDRDNFIGAIIGPNEERLHPEHHAVF